MEFNIEDEQNTTDIDRLTTVEQSCGVRGCSSISCEPDAGTSNTLIDVKNAYFQVQLDPNTSDATSFMTPLGLLEYAVLPQGIINSVSEFQNILARILASAAKYALTSLMILLQIQLSLNSKLSDKGYYGNIQGKC